MSNDCDDLGQDVIRKAKLWESAKIKVSDYSGSDPQGLELVEAREVFAKNDFIVTATQFLDCVKNAK